MSFKTVFRITSLTLAFTFALVISQSTLFTSTAQAADSSPLYVGEAMANANGDVFVISTQGERLKMDSFPMPIFDDSTIVAEKGSAVISLAPDGIVEVLRGSEVNIDKYGARNVVSINSGSIRFSVPSTEVLSIAIPSEGISITLASSDLASTANDIPVDTGQRAGFVELREDGTAVVSSSKGPLEVSTVEGKTIVLAEGRSVKIARAGGSTGSKAKAVAAATKTHDLIMLGATVGLAGGVAVISANTDSGGGWVASSP
ncbi:MAG: hypothetical protein IME98_06575 [Proteobacteria bacterium]|nr:hypothetical protein [Pseudomonadota bacterium]